MAENMSQNGGAQSFLKEKLTPLELLIKRVHSRFGHNWAISSKQHLLELLGKNNGVYEVTTSYPHKVYFDIDKNSSVKINEVEYMNKLLAKLNIYYPNAEYAVSGSNHSTGKSTFKMSMHIIVHNYLISNASEFAELKHLAKYLKHNFDDGFDDLVYKSNQVMKAVNQSKRDGRVQIVMLNDDMKAHLVTCYFANPSYTPNLDLSNDNTFTEDLNKVAVEKELKLHELPKLTAPTTMEES